MDTTTTTEARCGYCRTGEATFPGQTACAGSVIVKRDVPAGHLCNGRCHETRVPCAGPMRTTIAGRSFTVHPVDTVTPTEYLLRGSRGATYGTMHHRNADGTKAETMFVMNVGRGWSGRSPLGNVTLILDTDGTPVEDRGPAWAPVTVVEVYCEQHGAWEPEDAGCDGAATAIREVVR